MSLQSLYSGGAARELDHWAVDTFGIPELELMENASTAIVDLVSDRCPDGDIVVCVGKGNNGGDGLACARLLTDRDRAVTVALVYGGDQLSRSAKVQLERLKDTSVDVSPLAEVDLSTARVVIDGLLGTGAVGAPRAEIRTAIERINACKGQATIVAVDIASGVDSDSGEISDIAVEADWTVALHSSKLGHWILPGKRHSGVTVTRSIGIPDNDQVKSVAQLIDSSLLTQLPSRGATSSKFSSGHLVVIGGSTALTGAICMASQAAMRAGAGYVTAAVPRLLESEITARSLEVMVHPVGDGHHLNSSNHKELMQLCARADSVVIGPGLGRDPSTIELVLGLITELQAPLLLDADALFALAKQPDVVRERQHPTVRTPHSGELARLIGAEREQVQAERLATHRRAVELTGAIVVSKGDDTIVGDAGQLLVSRGDAAGLATAGSGDVLSGIAGALLARSSVPLMAVAAAVELHRLSGQQAATTRSVDSVIASDVIDAIGLTLHKVQL